VSLSGDLSLLPFDALLRSGDPQLEIVWSLRELTNERREVEGEPTVLTLGSVDYDSAPLEAAPRFDVTATPILEDFTKPQPVRSAEADTAATGDSKPKHFAALANTEARQVGTLFAKAFPTAQPAILTGQSASEAAFATGAPGKTYLHLATHGYFAPESAWKATEARGETRLARFSATKKDRVGQLSPYSLCGVALAGANLPANELGRREGILTAQEIGQIDLSSCYLATLSACNTSLGIRRAGAKLASLRSAFHSAGARHVLSTLWEIHDAQAQQLMADFYNRLWKQGQDPRAALRGAQQAARKRGAPFRDWAGWVLTGR
jgi:CHAT domain-containing protein